MHLRAHLAALAHEMRLPMAEVYEVATFYAHFDVLAEGEAPPPRITVRVCDSLSCEFAGARALLESLPGPSGPEWFASQSRHGDRGAAQLLGVETGEDERHLHLRPRPSR